MDDEGYFRNVIESPFAYEQCMYDMNRRMLNILNRMYYPYETRIYKSTLEFMQRCSKYGQLNERTINQIFCDLQAYIFSQQLGTDFDG